MRNKFGFDRRSARVRGHPLPSQTPMLGNDSDDSASQSVSRDVQAFIDTTSSSNITDMKCARNFKKAEAPSLPTAGLLRPAAMLNVCTIYRAGFACFTGTGSSIPGQVIVYMCPLPQLRCRPWRFAFR
jgi:hypothetical protein